MLEALAGRGRYGDVWVEHPDSDAGKPLAGL
jgi:23S rRNA (cytidine2498-2'-O)-methyltransferase